MLDLGPHASFIIAAYGVTVLAVGALVVATVEDDRKQRRTLAELERKGIRRRSAAKPTPPTVSPTVKSAVKSAAKKKAPAKRTPAKPRARKAASARKTSSSRKTPS